MYLLDASDLANGMTLATDLETLPTLSAEECATIGKRAYWINDYYHAAIWMDAAWRLVQGGDDSAGDGADILDYFSFSLSQQGDIKQARDVTLKLIELRPDVPRYRSNLDYYTNELEIPMTSNVPTNFTAENLTRPPHDYEYRNVYEQLCRGEGVGYAKEVEAQLTCFYHHGRLNDFTTWAPIKAEMLYPNPLVVQFYDITTDAETQMIRDLAEHELKRATIRDPKTGILTTAHYRVQKTAWLKEGIPADHMDVVARYNRRIQSITGLNINTAELLQLGNYGVGGQYEPHWDHQSHPGSISQWDEDLGRVLNSNMR